MPNFSIPFTLQAVVKNVLILAARPMNLEGEESEEDEEEEEATPLENVEAHVEVPMDQSPSSFVAKVLTELASQEEVAESLSSAGKEPIEARSFIFKRNKEGELPADIPIEQPLTPIVEEVMLVE